jgi:mannose-6-phosphate isomerase-like protein (cupin superfamily)
LRKYLLTFLVGGALAVAVVPSLRYRAGVWVDAIQGGPGSPTLRGALVESAPYRYQNRMRRWIGPRPPQIFMPLIPPDPAEAERPGPLVGRKILTETVYSAEFLNIHYSRLEEGQLAHDVHQHDDEEILVPISGDVEILGDMPAERIGPGSMTYYSVQHPHTIRALGPGPSTYIMWRWSNSKEQPEPHLAPAIHDFRLQLQDALERAAAGESVKDEVFAGGTRWLTRLHAHLRTLPAGGRIQAHEDDHDAILVLFQGRLETQGRTLEGPAISFNPAFSEHGMYNPGPEPAQYLAVDLTP